MSAVKVMPRAAETCTAAGTWSQLLRAPSNSGQPDWQDDQEVGRLAVRGWDEGAALLVGVPDGRSGPQPGGVLETDALEGYVVHRVRVAPADLQQRRQAR